MITEVADRSACPKCPAKFYLDVSSEIALVRRGSFLRHGDGEAIPFDPDHAIKLREEPLRKETGATIGIDQYFLARRQKAFDQPSQGFPDFIIGLREDARAGM